MSPELDTYGAEARVERMGGHALDAQRVRDQAGTLGDPVRALEGAPGVQTVYGQLPFFGLRGIPPGGTRYTFDDMRVPGAFHLGAGPSFIHPRVLDTVTLYSGAAPARYGGYAGGVVALASRQVNGAERVGGEAELRVLDVNGAVGYTHGRHQLQTAARYGYPGKVLEGITGAKLDYWDYHGRYTLDLGRVSLSVGAIGSFDRLEDQTKKGTTDLRLEFHRVEARLSGHYKSARSFGAAVMAGMDRSSFFQYFDAQTQSLRPRIWWTQLLGTNWRLELGGEAMFISGGYDLPDAGPTLRGDLIETRRRGSYAGFASLVWALHRSTEIELGGRVQAWHAAHWRELGWDPRLRLRTALTDFIHLEGNAGASHQPITFALPIAGTGDVPIRSGLTQVWHFDAGARARLPADVSVAAKGFLALAERTQFAEPLFEDYRSCPGHDCGGEFPLASVTTRGVELFAEKTIGRNLDAWLAYTLAWVDARSELDVAFTPSTDVRHAVASALQTRIGVHWVLGFKLQAHSGRLLGRTTTLSLPNSATSTLHIEQRAPWYARVDVSAAYEDSASWGAFRIALELYNLLWSAEPLYLDCGDPSVSRATVRCEPHTLPRFFVPNLSARVQF